VEIAIQRMAIVCFLIIGLSHIVQARAWAEFFIYLRGKGLIGVFIVAFIHLPMGVLIRRLPQCLERYPGHPDRHRLGMGHQGLPLFRLSEGGQHRPVARLARPVLRIHDPRFHLHVPGRPPRLLAVYPLARSGESRECPILFQRECGKDAGCSVRPGTSVAVALSPKRRFRACQSSPD